MERAASQRERPDFVIGLGGGSTIDRPRPCRDANEGPLLGLRFRRQRQRRFPMIPIRPLQPPPALEQRQTWAVITNGEDRFMKDLGLVVILS